MIVQPRDTESSSVVETAESLIVSAHGRIHLGLLQTSTDFSVVNMGIGFAIEHPCWRLRVSASDAGDTLTWSAPAPVADELLLEGRQLFERLGQHPELPSIDVTILEAIPEHRGFGSKTALLCALVRAKAEMAGRPEWWPRLRHLTRRGGTSGIGVNVALGGGFVLDGGHREGPGQPLGPSSRRRGRGLPLAIGQWTLPPWPLLLVTVADARRRFGRDEEQFFDRHLPLDRRDVESVAATVLFELVPAVAEGHYEAFVRAVRRLQEVGFKAREWSGQDRRVLDVRRAAIDAGADCVALSSVGPTVAVFAPDLTGVADAMRRAGLGPLDITATSIRNQGIACLRSP